MSETPEPAEGQLAEVVESLRDLEYDVTQPLPGVVHAKGRFSNPERIALRAAAVAGDQPVAVWAVSHRDDWVLVGWARPDLVTITYRAPSPQRWRHRRIPDRMAPDAPTFLDGAASPFDIVTRPKHQPTEAAREVLASFGVTDPAPPGWEPPVVVAPEPTAVVVPAKKPRRTAAPRPAKPAPAKRTEPTTRICPTCFMALPATGICDNCG